MKDKPIARKKAILYFKKAYQYFGLGMAQLLKLNESDVKRVLDTVDKKEFNDISINLKNK